MERDSYSHLKDVSRKLAIVGVVLGSGIAGAATYRAVSPYESALMPLYSSDEYESDNLSSSPTEHSVATTSSPESGSALRVMLDIYACYPINNMLSFDNVPDITCTKPESDPHTWMKNQSKNLRDTIATPISEETSIRRLERDIYAAADSCHERVITGARYSVYDDYEKNLDGCYRYFGFTNEMIADYETNQTITSGTLSSRVVSDQESALTIRDSVAPGEPGFRP